MISLTWLRLRCRVCEFPYLCRRDRTGWRRARSWLCCSRCGARIEVQP